MVYSKIIREACLKVELKQNTPQYIKEMIKKDETSYTDITDEQLENLNEDSIIKIKEVPYETTVAKNQGQMSNEHISNNINTPSYTEIADTNDSVVKEEDISNVVPNNDEDIYEW